MGAGSWGWGVGRWELGDGRSIEAGWGSGVKLQLGLTGGSMTVRRRSMRSQRLVFTLYGDFLRYRVEEAWTGSLIQLLGPLGLSSQAVRSTLSRMSRKGWLVGRRSGRFSFYAPTAKTVRLLDEGVQRLFAPQPREWDGRWHILTYSVPETRRQLRDRLRERLAVRGFGRLGSSTWISPYEPGPEVTEWLASAGAAAYVHLFRAEHTGFSEARRLAAHAWDLGGLNRAYRDFLDRHEAEYGRLREANSRRGGMEPVEGFVRRFELTLSYLSFPYVDPGLDPELLPEDWLGDRAAELFREYHSLLTEKAGEFVDMVLAEAPSAPAQ